MTKPGPQALPEKVRRFTGRHMTLILVTFFAVVIAVNFTMATLAIKGFGGTVVDNSYVASQAYNGWLEAARVQARLGWTAQVALDPSRHVRVTLNDAAGIRLSGAQVTGIAEHPLGRLPDRTLAFRETTPGVYTSAGALPNGRWQVALTVRHDRGVMRIAQEVR